VAFYNIVIHKYIHIRLKSLAPISGLTRLLASQKRFCCKLSQKIITKWWRHGTTANKEILLGNGRTLNNTLKSCL